jgi:hypothetical protein
MRDFIILFIVIFIFGCANSQNQITDSDSFALNRDTSKDITSTYSMECRNCMAQFKVKLKSKKFTKEELYKICPVCKR